MAIVPNFTEELSKCQGDFEYFVENYIKIKHPIKGIIPFELYDYQKRFIRHIEENKYSIGVKFRQGGFTTLSVVYGIWRSIFFMHERVYFVCRTLDAGKHMMGIVPLMLYHLPTWMHPNYRLSNGKVIFKNTESEIHFSTLEKLRGSDDDITFLFFEEAAFIPKIEEHWKYIDNMDIPHVVVTSTPSKTKNWFYETWVNSCNNDFVPYECSYKEHPVYADETYVEELRKSLGEKAFEQEILGNFVVDHDIMTSVLKVKDLIRSLSSCDPELPVYIIDKDGHEIHVSSCQTDPDGMYLK